MLSFFVGEILLLLSLLLVLVADLHLGLRLRLLRVARVLLVGLHLQHLLELCVGVGLFLFFLLVRASAAAALSALPALLAAELDLQGRDFALLGGPGVAALAPLSALLGRRLARGLNLSGLAA